MPGFSSIINQTLPITILKTFLSRGAIPHALLFSGIEGIGKKSTAVAFAMACNCLESAGGGSDNSVESCGGCRSCRKISSGNHPDVLLVKPEGASMRIAQVRELCRTLALKPYEAQRRVAIIDHAQAMTAEAANAFLKMLEEPPDRTLLVLVVTQVAELLPTILSRCHHIRFQPLQPEQIADMLAADTGMDRSRALVIGNMANGSVTQAFAMAAAAGDHNWMRRRDWITGELADLASRPVALILAFAQILAANKNQLQGNLQIMASWFRDLMVCRHDPGILINADLNEKVHDASEKVSQLHALACVEAVHSAEKQLQQNANPRLAMETLMLKLAGYITA